jgi:nicotinamidase-related amidase
MTTNALYLVCDMINDLVHEEGPNGKTGFGPELARRNTVARTAEALAKARAAGVKVGYVRVGFSADYRECPPSSPVFSKARDNGLFKLGTSGTEVHPDIKPMPGDYDIVKHRVSPFYATNLEAILRGQGITRIYFGGVSSVAVVQATARDGHDRDYEMVLLEDCCASFTAEEHANSMAMLGRFARITTSAEVQF